MDRGLEFLLLDLTHVCNLNCDFCGKLVWDSDYEMTMEQVDKFCYYCANVPAKNVRITGGEALTHPHIDAIIDMVYAMGRPIELATNGILLHRHESIIPKCWKIHLTPYPGVNDEAVTKYGQLPNMNLISINVWFDPFLDPNYTDREARLVYDNCCHVQVNVHGDVVYPCCQAETFERVLGIDPVHVELKEGWMEEYGKLDVLPACKHCFLAATEENKWR